MIKLWSSVCNKHCRSSSLLAEISRLDKVTSMSIK